MRTAVVCLVFCTCMVGVGDVYGESLDRTCRQGDAVVEWSVTNPSVEGNPFDVVATVTFRHASSGHTRRTEMFYAGEVQWRFRFLPSEPGAWTVETASDDSDLDGHRGVVQVEPAPGSPRRGMIGHQGNHWVWSASGQAFVPQIVMYRSPDGYFQQPDQIDRDLEVWFGEHGFNGLHTAVLCRWFNLEKASFDEVDDPDPNPDPRTFEALELLIGKAHAAGGFVHIWAWGDESRGMTPAGWGINGAVDRRLQRYIAARLGPLPGWTMGYGFDLWEWVNADQLVSWHDYLHQHLSHPHLIGGRVHRNTDPLGQLITDQLDYIGYETHRPSYQTYVEALERHPDKPVLMEDRFRVRDSEYPEKDYDLAMVRRGLWQSAMAGGVGNIWGYLLPSGGPQGMSRPFPNREQIHTYARFLEGRFRTSLVRAPERTDGAGLIDIDGGCGLFYKEECERVEIDLSGLPQAVPAVAVDTLKPYREIDLGRLAPKRQTVELPHPSDWAIAVGEFSSE